MMTHGAVHVDSPERLAQFLLDVDYLHDALLREAVLLHPGFVDRARQMWQDNDLPDAQLIFQSQSPDFAVVLVTFCGVTNFRYDPQLEFQLDGEFVNGGLVLYLAGKANANYCEIRASKAEYRILGDDLLGNEYRLVARSPLLT